MKIQPARSRAGRLKDEGPLAPEKPVASWYHPGGGMAMNPVLAVLTLRLGSWV